MKMGGPEMAPQPPQRSSRPGNAVARLVWLGVACVLVGCAAPDTRTAAAAPPRVVEITLLQINDPYVLEPVDGGRPGGMAPPPTAGDAPRAPPPDRRSAP